MSNYWKKNIIDILILIGVPQLDDRTNEMFNTFPILNRQNMCYSRVSSDRFDPSQRLHWLLQIDSGRDWDRLWFAAVLPSVVSTLCWIDQSMNQSFRHLKQCESQVVSREQNLIALERIKALQRTSFGRWALTRFSALSRLNSDRIKHSTYTSSSRETAWLVRLAFIWPIIRSRRESSTAVVGNWYLNWTRAIFRRVTAAVGVNPCSMFRFPFKEYAIIIQPSLDRCH